jgi:transglutaminase-like putative cysteine protease
MIFMTERRFNFDLAFKVLVIAGLSLSLSTPIVRGLGYSGPGFWARLVVTLAALGFYLLLEHYPLTALLFPLTLALLYRFYYLSPQLFLDKLTALFSLKQPANSLFWPLVTMGLITLAVYLVVFRARRSLPLLFAAGFTTTALFWYRFVDVAYPAAITFSVFWLMLLSYNRGMSIWAGTTESTESASDSSSRFTMRKTWLTYTVSILTLTLLFTLVLPKNIAPAPWPRLHSWAAEHLTCLQSLRPAEEVVIRGDGAEFNLLAFGRPEEKDLGGPLYLDNTVLLEVRGRGGSYLRGSVLDFYNGYSWSDTAGYQELDSLPRPPEQLQADLAKSDLTIRHLRLQTSTLFTGLYPQVVTAPPGTILVNENSGLKLEKSVPLYYEYRITCYSLLYRPAVEAGLETEDLLISNRYLQLPDSLPLRVINLALELTANQPNSYAKIKALEGYLRRHYSYTTAIPNTPKGRDFVDHFLFDLQEGYCTYFATALAVMGRAAGVPTRYLSGFVTPAIPAANGAYYVAGTDAHAWMEAYLPGLGWLPFEATPGYTTDSSLPFRIRNTYQQYFSGVGPTDDWALIGRGPREFDPDQGWSTAASGDPLDILQLINRLLLAGALFALVLLTALLALVLFRLRQIKQHFKKLDGLSSRGQVVGYYNLTLTFLEQLDLGKYPGETPQEYSLRIARAVHFWDLNFNDISVGVSLALYSHQPVPADLVGQVQQFFQIIFDRYLATAGKLTAFVEILVRGRFFSVTSPLTGVPDVGRSIF